MLLPQYEIYPLNQTELAELKKQIIELLKENKIRVYNSPSEAPIFFTKKKDEQLCLRIDYHALNKNTISASCPLLYTKELLS